MKAQEGVKSARPEPVEERPRNASGFYEFGTGRWGWGQRRSAVEMSTNCRSGHDAIVDVSSNQELEGTSFDTFGVVTEYAPTHGFVLASLKAEKSKRVLTGTNLSL